MNESVDQHTQDEVAAAEAALKVAQERLDAARKRAQEQQPGAGGQQAYAQQAFVDQQASANQQPYAQQATASQQTYAQPSYAQQQPYSQQTSSQQQTYAQPTYTPPAVGTKDHVAAGLLAIIFGWLGIHKFYLGYNTSGFIMLGVSILGGIVTFSLAAGVMCIIGIVEGILYLTKSQSEFEQMYVFNKREWF